MPGYCFTIVHDSRVTLYEFYDVSFEVLTALSVTCVVRYVSYFYFTTLSVSKIIYILWLDERNSSAERCWNDTDGG
jgi:hypothetical protein